MPGVPLVRCSCDGGPPFWTTKEDCAPRAGCTMVPTVALEPPPELVPYTLPSGKVIVGSYGDYLADDSTLVGTFFSPIDDLSNIKDDAQVICRLPSGLGVLETLANSKLDHGKVTGMLFGKVGDHGKVTGKLFGKVGDL